MKIIIYNDRPDYAGGTMYYERFKSILHARNITVTIKTATNITSKIARLDMVILKYLSLSLLSYIRVVRMVLSGHKVVYGSNIFLPKVVRNMLDIRVIAWFPDFQMHDLPQMFSKKQIRRRKLFEKRLISFSDTIMVQNDVDLNRMADMFPSKEVRVLKFYQPKNKIVVGNSMGDYHKDYILIAAQGWRHKRIDEIVSCYESSNKKYDLVLIGSIYDPRDPEYSQRLKRLIEASSINYLGFVDEQKKIQLFSNCRAVLNFSLYEGWNSSIEEAISFNKPLILSDIPIHREQVPEATFVLTSEQLSDVFSGDLAIQYLKNSDDLIQRRIETIDSFVRDLCPSC